MGSLSNAGDFLITFLFGTYILAVMLRLVLQLVRADFHNQISQFIVKVTNPPLKPLRRLIPGFAGIDMASVVFMLSLQMTEFFIVGLLRNFPAPDILGLVIYAAVELIFLGFYVFLFSIFILAILSWINPGHYNPVNNLLQQIANPILRHTRKIIPPMSGIDLSVMFTIVILWLFKLIFLDPLNLWAVGMAYPAIRLM